MKVAICTPHVNDMVPSQFARQMFNLAQRYKDGVFFFSTSYQPIAKARNELIHKVLLDCPDIEHILFIDDDIIMPTEGLKIMLEADKAIVSAWCPIRAPFVKSNVFPDTKPMRGLMELDEAGTGCMLIRREVFDKISQGQPIDECEFFRWVGSTLNPLSEDIYFCRVARAHGFKTWCHTDIITTHLGMGKYTYRLYPT